MLGVVTQCAGDCRLYRGEDRVLHCEGAYQADGEGRGGRDRKSTQAANSACKSTMQGGRGSRSGGWDGEWPGVDG